MLATKKRQLSIESSSSSGLPRSLSPAYSNQSPLPVQSKSLRQSPVQATVVYSCTLPPTCDPPRHPPSRFTNPSELESHHRTHHAHTCALDGCLQIFPSERFLELHQRECHDPILEIKRERNQKTFACFETTCDRLFRTPKTRRLHLIDFHHYPPTFFFSLPNQGLATLYKKYGTGVSLVRPTWNPRPPSSSTSHDLCNATVQEPTEDLNDVPLNGSPKDSSSTEARLDTVLSGLQKIELVPRQIQFGKKSGSRTFQR